MAPQIRIVLTVDASTKEIIKSAAKEFSGGNASAYLRGLALLHEMLLGRGTRHADVPGWLLGTYSLDVIADLRETLKEAQQHAEVDADFAAPARPEPRKPAHKPRKK